MQINTIIHGDVTDKLRCLPDESINCVVTSPPYWGLRDYGAEGQLGLEETPQDYVAKLVAVFREIKRVLTDDGTVWLNLGDSYSSQGGAQVAQSKWQVNGASDTQNCGETRQGGTLKPKNLIGLPWRVAFALQDDGWYLRNDIIWHKVNPMPESVTDRCTKAHEYVFLLTKSARYWFDQEANREPHKPESLVRYEYGLQSQAPNDGKIAAGSDTGCFKTDRMGDHINYNGRNARTVWSIATKPYKGSHFAVMPPELARRCIVAGCPSRVCVTCGAAWVRHVQRDAPIKTGGGNTQSSAYGPMGRVGHSQWDAGAIITNRAILASEFVPTCNCNAPHQPGIVLDPFFGAGTTGVVAQGNGRHWLGIELNQEYISLAWQRIKGSKISLPGIF